MAQESLKELAILLLFAVSHTYCQIDQPPSSATAKIGDTITLICQVSDANVRTEWIEYNSDPAGVKIFISSSGITGDPDKYDVEGSYNLIIKNLEFTDGGLYGCISGEMLSPATANLVVMEEPQAISGELIEGDTTLVSCSTRYTSPDHGDMDLLHIPQLEGYIYPDNVISDSETVKTPEYYTIKIDMNYTGVISDNGKDLTCRTYTLEPAYEDYGMLPMNVEYEVRDIDLIPNNVFYYVGEYINCTASGNPYPEFKWVAESSPGPRPVTGQTLTIEMNMVGDNKWICQATNTVKGIVTIEIEKEFEVREDETGGGGGNEVKTPPEGYVIALSVLLPLVIIGVLVVLGVVFWKKRMAPSKKPPPSIEEPPKHQPQQPSHYNPNFQEESFQEDNDISGYYPGYSNIATVPTRPQNITRNQADRSSPFYPTHTQPNIMGTNTGPIPQPRNSRSHESPGYADLGIRRFPGGSSSNLAAPNLNSSKSSLTGQNVGYGVNPNPNVYVGHPGLENLGYNRSNSRIAVDNTSMNSSMGNPETAI